METKPASVFEQLANAVNAVLPSELASDVRKNVQAVIKSSCERMELVTREELEVQEAVLARTRAKLEQLELQVKQLEQARGVSS
jgi:BMFP domain-containing protein YqiC